MQPRTWLEMFGPVTTCDYVDGAELVRWLGGSNYKTLMAFEKEETAQTVFDQWMLQTMQANSTLNRTA